MKTRIKTITHQCLAGGRLLTRLSILATAVLYHAAADDLGQQHAEQAKTVPAKLVEIVRNNTRQFVDVYNAIAAGYQPLFGCVLVRITARWACTT
jgi:type IV secretory pathway VirB2 component (pilin)